jgi:hypothetical protein
VRLSNRHYYIIGGFPFLEAKAHWEHTCIAGGFIGFQSKKIRLRKAAGQNVSFMYGFDMN